LTLAHWQALHVYQALTGNAWFADTALAEPALHQLWETLREPLQALHVSYYPGTRPYGWWHFEAPEPHQRVDGLPHPFTDIRYPVHLKMLSYGMPRYLFVLGDAEESFESQSCYLQRHRLLTGEEQRRVRAGDLPQWDGPGEPRLSLATVRLWWQEVIA
jgi:hypothetical protein